MRIRMLLMVGAVTIPIVCTAQTSPVPYPLQAPRQTVTASELSEMLAALRPQLQQLQAALFDFNNPAAVRNVTVAPPPQAQPEQAVPPPPSGANLSTNLSANTSSRLGANVGSNLSVPAGARPAYIPPTQPAPIAAAQPPVRLSPTTGRSLLALQQELQRVLPMIAAINNDPAFRTLASQSPSPGATATPQVPTPTGRESGRPAQPSPPSNLRVGQ